MPSSRYRNRVDPYGRLLHVAVRLPWMGNRGILHDEHGSIVTPYKLKAWLTCRLDYPSPGRKAFQPGRYSQLFFLDEASALAAGHRPCAQCRHARYAEFKRLWLGANAQLKLPDNAKVGDIDRLLHAERIGRNGAKLSYEEKLRELPDGVFIDHGGAPLLRWRGRLLAWSFEGYAPARDAPAAGDTVRVLTPRSIVNALAAGLVPQVHGSAEG